MMSRRSLALTLLVAWALVATYSAAVNYFSYQEAERQLQELRGRLAELNATVPVAVLIDYGNGTVRFAKAEVPVGSSVLNVTVAVAEVEYSVDPAYGAFVNSIDGVKNDPSMNMWWVYEINGKWGEVAADRQVVEAGDLVVWRYAKF